MKVKDLIAQLGAAYGLEEELAVAYWDRETVDIYADVDGGETVPLTEAEWSEVVRRYEDGEWAWQSWGADTFTDLVREVRETEGRA